MVHPLTHKAIAAYVLNTSVRRLPDNPQFNDIQKKRFRELEDAVDLCTQDVFEALSKESSFTLKVNNYIDLFAGLVLASTGALKFVILELQERGMELEESSSKIRYGIFQSTEFELVRKQKEESKSKE